MKLTDLARLELTYEPRGLTLDGPLPAGYQHLEVERRLGAGDAAYRSVSEALMTYAPQRGLGLRPAGDRSACRRRCGHAEPARGRSRFRAASCGPWRRRTAPASATAPSRVTSRAARRASSWSGAATTCMPWCGPTRGPAAWLTRLGGPLTWRLQGVAALGYLRALQRAVREDG